MINRETAKQFLETRGYPNPDCDYENELLDTMVEYAQHQAKNNEVLDLVSYCPLCNSDNLHQYKLHHIHCKDCKEDFNKSCG